jgi:putative hydroxymethylpyrimidine transport system ATP-binding protein
VPDTPAPTVHLHAASLDYAGAPVFAALDLTLPAGQTTCLLGPSGVGKTSLLHLVAGLLPGAAGAAADEHGRTVQGRIAYLAQQDLLLPWLSTLDNVLIGSRLRGEAVIPPVMRRAQDLLARVGLAGREGDRPGTLSGGMRQRVALARTLMEDRPIVLMDEPFSSLDAITRYDLQGLAAECLAGRTVLLVTHDPLEALRLGHRVLVMSGVPAALGEPQIPTGQPPRDPANAELLGLQANLLKTLSRAKALQDGPMP